MAQPFEKFYYNGDVERYIRLMVAVMSRIKINSERGLTEVPLTVGMGRRNDMNRGQASNLLPMGVLVIGEDVTVDKTQTTHHRLTLRADVGGATQRNRIPIVLPFSYYVKTKKASEAFQIQEQILGEFTPSLDCRVVDNEGLEVYQNIKMKLMTMTITDNWENDGVTPLSSESTYNFELYGYIYRNGDTDGSGLDTEIKEIIVDLGTDMDIPWTDLKPWFTVDVDGVHPADEE